MNFLVKSTETGTKFDFLKGEEVLLSSEVYSSKDSCLNGVESVKNFAPEAPVEDQTVANYAEEKCPKFEVYEDQGGKFRFRLKANNGQIIGHSNPHDTVAEAKNALQEVKNNVVNAPVDDQA